MSFAMPISNTLSLPVRNAGVSRASSERSSSLDSAAPSMSSTDILRGQKAVEINHNGSTYRLQATRLGKLILTK